jgi:hypothetical protein
MLCGAAVIDACAVLIMALGGARNATQAMRHKLLRRKVNFFLLITIPIRWKNEKTVLLL